MIISLLMRTFVVLRRVRMVGGKRMALRAISSAASPWEGVGPYADFAAQEYLNDEKAVRFIGIDGKSC